MNAIASVALATLAYSGFLDSKPVQSKPIAAELLAKARWVEGLCVRPANTPEDERIEVVAHAVGLPSFNDFAVVLDDSARFKVAFAHDARRGKLQLRSRYAVLDDEPAWLPKSEPRVFELAPELGAWLSGKVTTAHAPARLERSEVTMRGVPTKSGGRIVERRTRLAPDGSFECGGLACDHTWSATVVVDGHRALIVDSIGVEPGKHVAVSWTVSRGATLAGRVVDESGRGVSGAKLVFDCRSDPLAPLPDEIAHGVLSSADGSFRAAHLYPGAVLVRVERADFVPLSAEYEDLADDEVRNDLVIVLKQGLVLKGLVVDPERVPVPGARVSITQPRPGFGDYEHALVTGADGTFTCAGLGPQPTRIVAEKVSPERVLRIDLPGVDPTRTNCVVTLAERFTVKGRVLDDLGRTVLRYTAGVRRIDPDDPAPKPRTIDIKGEDGLFAIDDLVAGPWEVFAYGRGIVFEPARRVEVPHAPGEVVFVVRRPARISGRVIQADGSPAVRALVGVEWDRPAMFGGGMMKEQTSVTASHEGQFELTEIFPGRVRLSASSEDGTARGVATVDLVSGEVRGDLVISIAR